MELVSLTPDYPLTDFDCGDEDLNKFLLDDAKPSQELRIANTFILEADDGRIAAYFCLLSDKVSKDEVIGSRWKKVRSRFPKGKQFRSYPSVKIGRLAVSGSILGFSRTPCGHYYDGYARQETASRAQRPGFPFHHRRCLPLCRSIL